MEATTPVDDFTPVEIFLISLMLFIAVVFVVMAIATCCVMCYNHFYAGRPKHLQFENISLYNVKK